MTNRTTWRAIAALGMSLPLAVWANGEGGAPEPAASAATVATEAVETAELAALRTPQATTEPFSRVARLRIVQTLQADGTAVERRETHTRILHRRGVGRAGQVRLVYQPEREALAIVQAYVLQADGQQRAAPAPESLPSDDGNPDRAVLAVRFPALKAGETTVLVYERKLTRPLFQGKFSWQELFHPATVYDDVQVVLDTPASLRTRVHATELRALPVEVKGGRRVQRWQWQQLSPATVARQNFSVLDLEAGPGLTVSTFGSYSEMARAYGKMVSAHFPPKADIVALARQGTRGITEPRAVVSALARWVSTHIEEEGECLGQGRAAPRSPSEVVASKTGNCTDQATLLQALLAAKGIVSTQALLNGGNVYRLPRVPTESVLNHVLNVVPSLNMHVDVTADGLAPGQLPFAVAGKTAFWVKGAPSGVQTPVPPVGSNRQLMHSRFDVQADGSVRGQVKVALEGRLAHDSRNRLALVPEEVIQNMVPLFFRGIQHTATGTFTTGELQSTASDFQFEAQFDAQAMVPVREGGSFKIEPLFYSERPIADYFLAARQGIEPQASVTCDHAHSEEHYTYTFPETVKVVQVPPPVSVDTPAGRYESSYDLQGQVLTVRRVLTDLTPGPVCTPAQQVAAREFARRAAVDEDARVLLEPVRP